MEVLEIIGEFLKVIFCIFLGIFVALFIVLWLHTTIETNKMVKESNVLLKELCVKQGLNPDSIISQKIDNDTVQVDIKNEEPNE